MDQVAETDVSVLIEGDSGTGKELVARALHHKSRLRDKPFVKVNCAALPHDLLESELFGYERGAFTGAYRSKPGKFELANNGTMFLDEIGEMVLAIRSAPHSRETTSREPFHVWAASRTCRSVSGSSRHQTGPQEAIDGDVP